MTVILKQVVMLKSNAAYQVDREDQKRRQVGLEAV
jgi:hypothetical protein